MHDFERISVRPTYPEISHKDVLRDPELWDAYMHQRSKLVMTGEPTWVIPSLDAVKNPNYEGPALDFYFGKQQRGLLFGNDIIGFDIFEIGLQEDSIPIQLNPDPIASQFEAQKYLVKYVRELIVTD